jgi:hypothetical protein
MSARLWGLKQGRCSFRGSGVTGLLTSFVGVAGISVLLDKDGGVMCPLWLVDVSLVVGHWRPSCVISACQGLLM